MHPLWRWGPKPLWVTDQDPSDVTHSMPQKSLLRVSNPPTNHHANRKSLRMLRSQAITACCWSLQRPKEPQPELATSGVPSFRKLQGGILPAQTS